MIDDQRREDLDRVLGRAAHRSMEGHRASTGRDETEAALQSVLSVLNGPPPRKRRRRGLVAVPVAAALVALVGALAVLDGGREESDPDVAVSSDGAATVVAPTQDVATTAPTSVAPAAVSLPASMFDASGNPLGGFLDDTEPGADQSAFVEVLHDYLIHRSDILGDSVAEREQQLNTGGLRIHTTLDPDLQAAALTAREELPSTSEGFDSSIVSIDTGSGAVRAVTGAPDEDTRTAHSNMAVTPRQTGSAIGLFITPAAMQTGVLADDVIDGRRGCRIPSDTSNSEDLYIMSGAAGSVGSVRDAMAMSLICGAARLSLIAGLEAVVDTTYELAASAYLDPTNTSPDRPPLEPFQSLATGANPLSALDMASGMQTIANEGVHHAPYVVEYIDDANGTRRYTHRPDPNRALELTASLATIDILKSVIDHGTGRRAALDDNRPAIGVTGTTVDSTNAWFIGATPQLATAVWVGDPAAYTPMSNIPEFEAAGFPNVQGGNFPATIWKTFTDTTHAGTPATDWSPPPEPTRPPARLVVPGVDCLRDPTSTNQRRPIDTQQPLTTVHPAADVVPCE